MNNDLEHFSEEYLKELINSPADELTIALARIALLVKQAKPVEVLQFIINNPDKDGYIEWADCNQDYFNSISIDHRRVLYTTPPAKSPAIPEWNNEQCLEFLQVAFRHNTIDGEIEFDDIRLGVKFALAAAPKPEIKK